MLNVKLDKYSSIWHEWGGLTCAFIWFFCSMNNYYEPLFNVNWFMFGFMMLLVCSLLFFSLVFGGNPSHLSKISMFTTIIGVICTILIPFLKLPAAFIVYCLSAVLMSPLLCRRLYGVIVVSRTKLRFRTYMSAVSVTIVFNITWAYLELPFPIKFSLIALFGLLGLFGIRRSLPVFKASEKLPDRKAAFSYRWIQIAAIVFLLFMLNIFSTLVHSFVVFEGMDNNNLYMIASAMLLPVAGFMGFSVFTDFKREKWGFTFAMTLVLLGCVIALLPGDNVLVIPLILAVELGTTAIEYYLLTIPLMFFGTSRNPVFTATMGLVLHTSTFAFLWIGDLWLPDFLLNDTPSRPLVIFGAICVILLFPLTFSLWEHHSDEALITALLALRHRRKDAEILPEANTKNQQIVEVEAEDCVVSNANVKTTDWISSFDILQKEHEIALLLCEGRDRTEISTELGISGTEVGEYLKSLRIKINAIPPIGRSLIATKMINQYNFTDREAEVFDELILGRSNREISNNLYVVEATVKFHVRNILKKAGVSNRSQLISQLTELESLTRVKQF